MLCPNLAEALVDGNGQLMKGVTGGGGQKKVGWRLTMPAWLEVLTETHTHDDTQGPN